MSARPTRRKRESLRRKLRCHPQLERLEDRILLTTLAGVDFADVRGAVAFEGGVNIQPTAIANRPFTYDFDTTMSKIRAANGLPDYLADRLKEGR